jgi:hypothetical protein
MGKVFDGIDSDLAAWIGRQRMYFVATAPGEGGHVNCSPKGTDSLRILGPRTVAYLDLTGSGAETIAHLRDNGRIVLMFCAFDGPPRIVRIHGHGSVMQVGDPRFADMLQHFLPLEDHRVELARSIICINADRVSDSCGFSVPLMEYVGERTQSEAWTENRLRKHGPDALLEYQQEKNLHSIDGLPAVDPVLQGKASALAESEKPA